MPEKPFVFLALSGRDASPETLAELSGGGRMLETTLPYTPPYETFKGIKELQLAVRRMGAYPPETLVLDMTEWLDHEEEEFFEITAMYLHDHRDLWNFVFLAREHSASECGTAYFILRTFLTGEMREDASFATREALAACIRSRACITPDAADELAGMLLVPQARLLRSYPRLDTLLREMGKDGPITAATVAEASSSPLSPLSVVCSAGRPSRPERRPYGKEAI